MRGLRRRRRGLFLCEMLDSALGFVHAIEISVDELRVHCLHLQYGIVRGILSGRFVSAGLDVWKSGYSGAVVPRVPEFRCWI
ncbi:unnamed protein product [Calypogeia fissa]